MQIKFESSFKFEIAFAAIASQLSSGLLQKTTKKALANYLSSLYNMSMYRVGPLSFSTGGACHRKRPNDFTQKKQILLPLPPPPPSTKK